MNPIKVEEDKESGKPYQIAAGVWMVPCQIDAYSLNYIPSLKPFKNGKKTKKPKCAFTRQNWSEQEDQILTSLVTNLGPKQWSSISTQLNIKIHSGLPVRFGKQCQERWFGTLNPEIIRVEWTREEDNCLIVQQMLHGNSWRLISESLPGRTENQVKNRWRKLDKLAKKKRKECKRTDFEEFLRCSDPWTLFCWTKPFVK